MTEDMTDESEDKEVEVLEFYLTIGGIDELIGRLNELKENKGTVEFEVDDENLLVINYDGDEE